MSIGDGIIPQLPWDIRQNYGILDFGRSEFDLSFFMCSFLSQQSVSFSLTLVTFGSILFVNHEIFGINVFKNVW